MPKIEAVIAERMGTSLKHSVNVMIIKNLSLVKVQEITDFFDKLPYNKLLNITLKNGNVVPYRICHAAHKPGVTEKESHDINLWERDYWGRCDPNELTVCGHTPTFDRDFNLRGADEDIPGFICYRNKMINIDCGRCYPYENHGLTFLAAICLETLEEFYDAGPEQRVREYASSDAAKWERQFFEKHGKSTESIYRKQIIEYFGFPEDTPFFLNRIS